MRNATSNKYPKYICFEQVPGAFSADGRNAFREMLEAIVQIVEPEAAVPPCDKGGWPTADLLLGNGWSLAYRVLDAKWYLPQRRSRIYAVCSFTNECACDILFEREGVCRNIAPRSGAWEGSAGDPSDCTGTAVSWGFEPGACSRIGGHFWKERTGCLRADTGDNQVAAIQYNPTASRIKFETDGLVQTLTSRAGTGGNSTALALSIAGNIIDRSSKNGGNGLGVSEEICYTLDATVTHGVAHTVTMGGFTETHEEQAATLMARDFKSPQAVNQSNYIIRRLLPQEYGRLQGYSDDWCEGLETPEPTEEQITWWAEVFETYRKITGTSSRPKSRKQIIKWLRNPYTDSAAYKMYGNSICVPCVCFVLSGIVDQVEHETGPTP
ncbi:hypothetical protein FACS18948_3900 [Clostridia bacterium]|nr:hypothetical protein FACS18948_3900 [Clostridia bacterium]